MRSKSLALSPNFSFKAAFSYAYTGALYEANGKLPRDPGEVSRNYTMNGYAQKIRSDSDLKVNAEVIKNLKADRQALANVLNDKPSLKRYLEKENQNLAEQRMRESRQEKENIQKTGIKK